MGADEEGGDTAAARLYVEAHELHYRGGDLVGALRAYERILRQHPDTPEAGYARSQVGNIVQQVVPEDERLTAGLELARRHVGAGGDQGG